MVETELFNRLQCHLRLDHRPVCNTAGSGAKAKTSGGRQAFGPLH